MIHHIIELHGAAYVARWTGSPQESRSAIAGARTHHKVVDLLEQGDIDAAVDLWRRHLDEASETVLHGVDAKTVLDLLD